MTFNKTRPLDVCLILNCLAFAGTMYGPALVPHMGSADAVCHELLQLGTSFGIRPVYNGLHHSWGDTLWYMTLYLCMRSYTHFCEHLVYAIFVPNLLSMADVTPARSRVCTSATASTCKVHHSMSCIATFAKEGAPPEYLIGGECFEFVCLSKLKHSQPTRYSTGALACLDIDQDLL